MKTLCLLLLTLSLSGCRSLLPERAPCPKTSILAEFSKTVDLQTGAPIRTEIDSLIPICTAEGNQTIIEFRLRLTSLRQLAHFLPPLTLKPSYFVAVVDHNGTILSRSNHEIEITFEEKQTTKVNFQRLQETVPVGKEVTLYVGFNLEEAQFNFLSQAREKKSLSVINSK
jgi:hypothetical protein